MPASARVSKRSSQGARFLVAGHWLARAAVQGLPPRARGCYHEIVTFLPRAAAGAGA